MSQELTDAEWLRQIATFFERGQRTYEPQGMEPEETDRLRSIADRLERAGGGWVVSSTERSAVRRTR